MRPTRAQLIFEKRNNIRQRGKPKEHKERKGTKEEDFQKLDELKFSSFKPIKWWKTEYPLTNYFPSEVTEYDGTIEEDLNYVKGIVNAINKSASSNYTLKQEDAYWVYDNLSNQIDELRSQLTLFQSNKKENPF